MESSGSIYGCSRERYTYVNSALVGTLMQGMYTVLLFNVIALSMNQFHSSKPSNVFSAHKQHIQRGARSGIVMMVIATTMYILTTSSFVLRWYSTVDAFGTNGDDPNYLCDVAVSIWRSIYSEGILGLNVVIADAVMVWRSYIVWGKSRRVVTLPALLTVVELALLLTNIIIYSASSTHTTFAYQTVIGVFSLYSLVYFALSLITTLYCTIAITVRIMRLSRANGTSLRSYRTILEIVIESALIYAIVLVIHVALFFTSARWGAYYSGAVLNAVTGIAPTLILSRVASEKSRPQNEWTGEICVRSELQAARQEMSIDGERTAFAKTPSIDRTL